MKEMQLVATIGYEQYIVSTEDAAKLFEIAARSYRVSSYPLRLDTAIDARMCSDIRFAEVDMNPEPEPSTQSLPPESF